MMDSPIHLYAHINWLELLEIDFFVLLVLLVLMLFLCFFTSTIPVTGDTKKLIVLMRIRSWQNIPEIHLLMLAVPLQLLWEIVQFPLFKGTWGYTDLMPVVPIIDVGAMPLLQWLLIPPVLLCLMHTVRPAQTYE